MSKPLILKDSMHEMYKEASIKLGMTMAEIAGNALKFYLETHELQGRNLMSDFKFQNLYKKTFGDKDEAYLDVVKKVEEVEKAMIKRIEDIEKKLSVIEENNNPY